MAVAQKQSFANELESLSRALEQAGKALSSLKCLHKAEMHSAENEVTAKVAQLMKDQPAMALPHQLPTKESLSKPGNANPPCQLEYTEKYQRSVSHSSAQTELCSLTEADLSGLAFLDTGCTSPGAKAASKDATVSEFAPSSKPAIAAQWKSSVPFAGQVREIWKAAEQGSVDRLQSRCNVHIRHHDTHSESDFHASTHKLALTARAHNAGAAIASRASVRAAIFGQLLYDMAFCILNPVGNARLLWNGTCLFLILYDLFVVPMQAFDIQGNQALQVIEWMLTIWWTVDVYITFRTGYIVGTRVEMRPTKIAIHYACTWLLCDTIIVVVEWVNRFASAFASASVMRSQRILRFFRIVKLLRIGKLSQFWKTLHERVNSNVTILLITVAILTGILLLTIHIAGCIWYALGESSDDGWTANDEYQGVKDEAFWYFAAIRWVIAQFNGRTDLDERRNMTERVYTCLCGVLLAVLAQSGFISLMTKALFDLSDVVSEKTRRRRLVNEYLEANPLSPVLVSQVKRFTNDYHDVDREIQKEDQVLAILPKHLQSIVLEETMSAAQYEKVFDKGDICERMLFMDKLTAIYGDIPRHHPDSNFLPKLSIAGPQLGSAQTRLDLLDFGKPLKFVKAGSWISEAALWVEWRNQGRLVSNGHGIMLAVSASNLAAGLSKKHPDAYSLAYLHGKNVALELSKQDPAELSDILPFEIQLYSPLCVKVTVLSARGLRNADGIFTGKSDPYCNCNVVGLAGKGGETRFKTAVIFNTLDPVWDHSAEVSLSRHQLLEFSIYDHDFGKKDQELGVARLLPEDFAEHGFDGELPLRTSDGAPALGFVTVRIRILDKKPEESGGLLYFLPRSKTKKKLQHGGGFSALMPSAP